MKEVSSKQNKVDLHAVLQWQVALKIILRAGVMYTHIIFDCELQNLLECIDRILPAYGITFEVSDMIVSRKHDTNCVIGDWPVHIRVSLDALQST